MKRLNRKQKSKEPERKVHKIDASGKILGRLAADVAVLLRGKHKVNFVPYLDRGDQVLVYNADKIRISGRKLVQKEYIRHTQYPGGLKRERMEDLFKNDPQRVFYIAVKGMLPKNRLLKSYLSHLEVRKGEGDA